MEMAMIFCHMIKRVHVANKMDTTVLSDRCKWLFHLIFNKLLRTMLLAKIFVITCGEKKSTDALILWFFCISSITVVTS